MYKKCQTRDFRGPDTTGSTVLYTNNDAISSQAHFMVSQMNQHLPFHLPCCTGIIRGNQSLLAGSGILARFHLVTLM